jgi:hypothetical protein
MAAKTKKRKKKKPAPRLAQTRAWKLYLELPKTPENREPIARAFLEEWGDIPAEVSHHFAMTAISDADLDAAMELVDRLRKAHFAQLGKPVPEYAERFR